MKIAVLSRSPELYSTQRIIQAGRRRNHYMIVLDHMECDLMIQNGKPVIYYEEQRLGEVDAVIPRIGSSATSQGESVIRHFEAMKVYSTLSSDALIHARNKYRAYQILATHDVPVPKSILSGNVYSADTMLHILGEPPYIIKLINSTHGAGVLKADNMEAAITMIEAFSRTRQKLMFQEYIEESAGEDIRVFIVGGQIVATMMRRAQNGDFRSNLHRGGVGIRIDLTQEEKKTALKATKVLGLDVAGVDLLRSNKGPMVLEVNASPGLEGIEGVTRVDIATKIITLIENKQPVKVRKE